METILINVVLFKTIQVRKEQTWENKEHVVHEPIYAICINGKKPITCNGLRLLVLIQKCREENPTANVEVNRIG